MSLIAYIDLTTRTIHYAEPDPSLRARFLGPIDSTSKP
jgi:hypothetical protein